MKGTRFWGSRKGNGQPTLPSLNHRPWFRVKPAWRKGPLVLICTKLSFWPVVLKSRPGIDQASIFLRKSRNETIFLRKSRNVIYTIFHFVPFPQIFKKEKKKMWESTWLPGCHEAQLLWKNQKQLWWHHYLPEELLRTFCINFFKRMIASHTFTPPKLPGQSLPWAFQSLVRQICMWAVFSRLGEKDHNGYKRNTTGAERKGDIFFRGELRRVSPKEATMMAVTPRGQLLGTSVWIQQTMRILMVMAQTVITIGNHLLKTLPGKDLQFG